MKKIMFLTGSENKISEAQSILKNVKIIPQKIDLPEIQAIDVKDVVKDKALRAYHILNRPLIVEDTGIYIKALKGFPGALTKWLIETMGVPQIPKLISSYKDKSAYAETAICYYDGKKLQVFTGRMDGDITKPKGKEGFGWDPIFKERNSKKTFAQMTEEEKNFISMRKIAFVKMAEVLKLN